MKIKFLFYSLLILSSIISCDKKQTTEFASAEFTSDSIISSAAATVQDKNKKFIHTADVNLDVKDVFRSTLSIEKSVLNFGGYIAKSSLQSYIVSDNTTPISKDSARETKIYRMINHMEVRIPQTDLNGFLLSLNKEIEFLNSRSIEATDVTVTAKSLESDKQRLQNTENKLDTLLQQKGNTGDKHDIINSADNVQNAKNQALFNKEILDDKIRLSTVTISLQEKDKIKQSVIANTEDHSLYTPSSFGYNMKTAFLGGINIFQSIIVNLFYLWPFWILLTLAFFLYRKVKRNRKNK